MVIFKLLIAVVDTRKNCYLHMHYSKLAWHTKNFSLIFLNLVGKYYKTYITFGEIDIENKATVKKYLNSDQLRKLRTFLLMLCLLYTNITCILQK